MRKRRIVLSLICVIGLLTIFISITILANIPSKSLNKGNSKKEYSVYQPSLSNENLEEKYSNKESNIYREEDDDISKTEKNQNIQSNNVSNKNTTAKTNINSNYNSNKVSNGNNSSNTNKNTSNKKTNSNSSSTNAITSNSNKPSNTNTNSQNNDAKEWKEFINSEAVYKILGGHKPDYYSEKEAKKKQDELLDLGYISSLRYACTDLSTGERCVYSVVAETGSGECSNSSSLEYDWRKVSKMGVVDYLVSKGYKCDGLTDPYSGKSY